MIEDLSHQTFDFLRQQWLRHGGRMDAIGLHQRRIAGRNSFQEPGQVVNSKFIDDTLENLLEAFVIGSAEIGRHAYSDQQYLDFMNLGELYHLPQIVCALCEAKSPEPVVAAQLDDQVGGLMLTQQPGQAM